MVTCQSANQLKTPAKVSWAFKMVSVWFTRRHNHGEDCWSDSCPEDNHWHPSQGGEATNIHCQRSCSQSAVSKHVNRKLGGRKRCTTNRENRRLMRIVKHPIQEFGWTSQGMDWGWGQGIKSTTHRRVEEFGYSCRQRRLTWAKRRRTGLLPSGPKSSFQMRASFVFHLETRVLESGGRVEKLIAQVAWSPVLSFHSLWWFGCNVICWCWSIVFFENQHHCTRLPRNFGALHASFCWPAF